MVTTTPDFGVGSEVGVALDVGIGIAVGVGFDAGANVEAGMAVAGIAVGGTPAPTGVALAGRVGIGTTVALDASICPEVGVALTLAAQIGVAVTSMTSILGRQPASSEPTINISGIQRSLRSMVASWVVCVWHPLRMLTPNVPRPCFHRITRRSRSGYRV